MQFDNFDNSNGNSGNPIRITFLISFDKYSFTKDDCYSAAENEAPCIDPITALVLRSRKHLYNFCARMEKFHFLNHEDDCDCRKGELRVVLRDEAGDKITNVVIEAHAPDTINTCLIFVITARHQDNFHFYEKQYGIVFYADGEVSLVQCVNGQLKKIAWA
jgi:hypothetical protein